MRTFAKFAARWKFGATVLVMSALSILGMGLLVAIPFVIGFELVGYESEDALRWVAILAIFWAPPAVAGVFQVMGPTGYKRLWLEIV